MFIGSEFIESNASHFFVKLAICKLKEAEEARAKAVIAEEQRYQDFWNGLRYFRNAQKLNESRFEDIESRRILKPLLPFRPQSGSSSFARTDNFEREFKSLTKKMENYFKNTTGEFGRYFEAKLERLHPRTEALLNRYYKYMET